MLFTWAKIAVAFGLCLTLVAAPCKNCQPKAPAQQQNDQHQKDCGHDCCPKPKPAQQACSWQPADFDAVEKAKDTSVAVPTMVELPHAAFEPVPAMSGLERSRPAVDPSPPPVYLSTTNLRF